MHVLTKIFIVLVCLLAILIVPLVVVYAHNEESYKQKYEAALAAAQAANSTAASADARFQAEVSRLDTKLQEYQSTIDDLQRQKADAEVDARRLQSELAAARVLQDEIRTDISRLASTGEANSQLTIDLVNDLESLQTQITTVQRQNIELDESLRDTISQLESAVAAQRALREELQRANEEKGTMLAMISAYQGQYGDLRGGAVPTGAMGGIIPDRHVVANVSGVREASDRTLVEIEAGSRDGVKEDWMMTIGRGATLIGRIRITSVDVNKSIGELMYDDRLGTSVQIGDKAYASPND